MQEACRECRRESSSHGDTEWRGLLVRMHGPKSERITTFILYFILRNTYTAHDKMTSTM